jgi:hypothetical protein
MRLTPAQIGMRSLLGHHLRVWMPDEWTLDDRIRQGRAYLVRLTQVDFEYDAVRWDEHLRQTKTNGYRGMPRQVCRAVNDPTWRQAVAELRARSG